MADDQVAEFREVFCLIDKDSDGMPSFLFWENEVDELKEAFKVFDRDQDGFISANELRQVMMNMGERLTMEEAEQMIREADLDGDGVVSFDEFARMMMVTL
ncbi:hypothetical protein GOBAR_AA13816 [Gossypium barbadense]|uniref:EF-hand domain-containing protein n=1 Tax=Gossypium barbadense TaxID=3634 RepID=A0A2P5XU08_GOSBA|nr:hypothetical protein GOBAR_AA13816 [Gossypium barbadense]